MNPVSLFTSFSGRINRAKWWIGIIVAFVLGTIASIAVNPTAMQAFSDPEAVATNVDLLKPTVPQLIVGLIFTVFVMAVVMKRLNDRNWPQWVGVVVGLIYIGMQVGQFVVLNGVTSMEQYQSSSIPFSIIGLLLFLFLLIDNGMLKGTAGPNQYGEDPLAHKHSDVA